MRLLKNNNSFWQLTLLFLTVSLLGQTIDAQSPYFHVIEPAAQLSASEFNVIYEDHRGRIYVGSDQGLLFFDGQKFHHIASGDSTFSVSAIYQRSNEELLIGCTNGVIFQMKESTLFPMELEEGFSKAKITGFQEDAEGRLWFATYGEGVYFLDRNRLYNIDEEDGLLGNDIYTIAKGADGKIWLGTDGGISICDYKNNTKTIRNITRENGLPDDIVHEIYTDTKGNCWIGMYDKGISRFNVEKDSFDFHIPDWDAGVVNCIEVFEEKEIWVGTEDKGLYRYLLEEKTGEPLDEDVGFSNAKIKDLLKDAEGNIWVLDNIHRMACANKQFETIPTPFNNIQSLLMDQDNELWIGTEQGLFCRKGIQDKIFETILRHKKLNVTSLYQDKFENIWIGTFGEGVYLYHKATKTINHFSEKDGLTNNSILSIDGVNGHIWLATLGGVTEIDNKENLLNNKRIQTSNYNQKNGLGTNFIYKVYIDHKERAWFGTDGNGLSVLENGLLRNYRDIIVRNNAKEDSISLKTIYAITEDEQGNIWFSTAKHGVFKFDGQHFHQLTLKKELRQTNITSLISDGNKNIILLYTSGVALLDPQQNHLIYYDYEVGLKDIDPNLNTGTIDNFGNIYFADQDKVIKYVALNEPLQIHPRTVLSAVQVNYQPVALNDEDLSFSHDQNNIIFQYDGLWYTAPEKVKYKYRLNGYNSDWIYSKDDQVSYSSLQPGHYTFEVSATENDIFHDEPVASYSFTIAKPFWQQLWFIALMSLLAFAGIYAFIKFRDERRQRESELQREKLSSQLATLKAQVNPHFLFNSFNTLAALIDENQEAAVEYVERLSDFYRHMLQYRDVDVIPIQEEIEIVKDYSYLLKKRFGDKFSIDLNVNGTPAYLAPLSLQTLVENAVKHNVISKTKPLHISIDIEGEDFVVVSNNVQKKRKAERSTHFGLQSLQRQYELLSHKKIRIEETAQFFKVGLPLIKK